MKKSLSSSGQGLVEFSLILPVFLLLMGALFDGCRLMFTYNEVQQAARVGARWAAVEVSRDQWGTTLNNGNTPGTYTSTPDLTVSSGVTSTILGQVHRSLVAVDSNTTSVVISQPLPAWPNCGVVETGTQIGNCTGMPITVTVSYTFVPVLAFGHVHIPLQGRAVAYHE